MAVGALGSRLSAAALAAGSLGRAHGGQHGGHRRHARQIVHRFFRRLAQRLHGGALARIDLDGADDAAILDDQVRNHALARDVALPGRLLDVLYGFHTSIYADHNQYFKTSTTLTKTNKK